MLLKMLKSIVVFTVFNLSIKCAKEAKTQQESSKTTGSLEKEHNENTIYQKLAEILESKRYVKYNSDNIFGKYSDYIELLNTKFETNFECVEPYTILKLLFSLPYKNDFLESEIFDGKDHSSVAFYEILDELSYIAIKNSCDELSQQIKRFKPLSITEFKNREFNKTELLDYFVSIFIYMICSNDYSFGAGVFDKAEDVAETALRYNNCLTAFESLFKVEVYYLLSDDDVTWNDVSLYRKTLMILTQFLVMHPNKTN